MTRGHHLAQVNIGRLKAPQDAPEIADFVANLDRINALAERQPGFVWRLTGDGGNAMDVRAFEDPLMAINMSVWASLDDLAALVYRSGHREIMRRRREWFQEMTVYQALWWTPRGRLPTTAEALERLDALERLGPTAYAFTFRTPFAPTVAESRPTPILEACV